MLTRKEFDIIECSLLLSIKTCVHTGEIEKNRIMLNLNNDALEEFQTALDSLLQLRDETYSR